MRQNDHRIGQPFQDQRIGAAVMFLQGRTAGKAARQPLDFAPQAAISSGVSITATGPVSSDAIRLIAVDQQIEIASPDQREHARPMTTIRPPSPPPSARMRRLKRHQDGHNGDRWSGETGRDARALRDPAA